MGHRTPRRSYRPAYEQDKKAPVKRGFCRAIIGIAIAGVNSHSQSKDWFLCYNKKTLIFLQERKAAGTYGAESLFGYPEHNNLQV